MGCRPLRKGARLYLDANAVIEILDRDTALSPSQHAFLVGISDGECFAATSELTLAECLVRPLRDKLDDHKMHYEAFLDTQLSAPLVPVDRTVLLLAAELRAASRAKLPDCIHVATAIMLGCTVIVSADRSLPLPASLRRIAFADIDIERQDW
jgi:predicted nucleic acid-binding protein